MLILLEKLVVASSLLFDMAGLTTIAIISSNCH